MKNSLNFKAMIFSNCIRNNQTRSPPICRYMETTNAHMRQIWILFANVKIGT